MRGINQMSEVAHRRFVRHRLAAEIDPDKTRMASESMPIRGPDCLPFDTLILRASPSWFTSLRPIRIPGRSMVALRPRMLHLNHKQGATVGRPDQRLLSDGKSGHSLIWKTQ
jgi:hypothetical protein